MSQFDVDRAQEFHKCIECFLCQDVCHVIRDHEENKPRYAGPRFFVRLAALEMHPLDTLDRRELIRRELGIGLCNITKCCTEVCPEGIHITDNAIIPLKERAVDAHYDPVALARPPDPPPAPADAGGGSGRGLARRKVRRGHLARAGTVPREELTGACSASFPPSGSRASPRSSPPCDRTPPCRRSPSARSSPAHPTGR